MSGVTYTAPGPVASAFVASTARRSLIMGPFGSGKSAACVMRVMRAMSSLQQRGPDGFRRSRWVIVRNTWPELRDTTMKTWFDWFPNGSVGFYRATEKCYYVQIGDIRGEVMFRALDGTDDIGKLLSAEYSGAWFNEFREIERDIVEAMDGRVTRYPSKKDGGPSAPMLFGDSNPPEEYSYMYHLMEGLEPDSGEPLAERGWEVFRQPSGLSEDAENIANLTGGREYYTELARGKARAFIDMYVHGKYGSTATARRVHPAFRADLHVCDARMSPDPSLPVTIACDFGLTPAMVLKQQDAFGRVRNIDEVVTDGMGLERAIQTRLKPLIAARYAGCRFFVTGDTSGNSRSQADETTCRDIFEREGFRDVEFCEDKLNNPIEREGATDFYLTTLGDDGVPLATYDRRGCPTLVHGMLKGYFYSVNKTKGTVNSSPVKNKYSHVCEASQYGDVAFRRGRVRARSAPAEFRAPARVFYTAR